MKQLSLFSIIISILLILLSAIFLSCRRNIFADDPNNYLTFSTDTVQFDTIFTGIGSTTKYLKIINTNKSKSINIDRIYLAKGNNSKYRFNIDGYRIGKVEKYKFENYQLAPGDSAFIFVEVTINPTTDNLVEQDSIIFEANGNCQDVKLVAFGQNVTLLNGQMITNDTTWTADKPILIYNSAMVDTFTTLTVMPGTKVYFHNKSSLFVKGTLKAHGEIDNRITFTGDRLEEYYRYTQGQWGGYLQDEVGNTIGVYGGIHLLAGSRHNEIYNADITNALIGLQVDSCVTPNIPTVMLKNTNIENSKIAGLYALGANIEATNCVFANSAQYTVTCWIGGRYRFTHCTMANYSSGVRQTPQVSLNNYYQYRSNNGTLQISYRNLEDAYFGNCIIYGFNKEEIDFDFVDGATANFLFDNCLIRYEASNELLQSAPNRFIDNIFNIDPVFMSLQVPYDYAIGDISPARNKAKIDIATTVPTDHDGKNRLTLDQKPDIGAFEFEPQQETKYSLFGKR